MSKIFTNMSKKCQKCKIYKYRNYEKICKLKLEASNYDKNAFYVFSDHSESAKKCI